MHNQSGCEQAATPKKRLLFVIQNFEIGGITSSLRSLLAALDYSKVEVDLFCREKSGPLKNAFHNANILSENIWLSSLIREGNVLKKMLSLFIKGIRVVFRFFGVDMNIAYGRIGGEQLKTSLYDAVISFHEGLSPIVCYYPAKKHIAWIHSDYHRYWDMVKKDESRQYEIYDRIVCVSEFARSVFMGVYPELADKIITIHNIIPVEEIKLKAKDAFDLDARFDNGVFTIVSVGRLDPVKQFDRIPEIASDIKRLTTIPFHWYIIGGARVYGKVDTFLSEEIQANSVEKEVVLLGEKNNVFPYVAQSDLYVCTSVSESFPLAINEAKALGVPVVSNAFPSVKESLVDMVEGRIVNLQDMAGVIVEIMNKKHSFKGMAIDNDTPLRQFYELI